MSTKLKLWILAIAFVAFGAGANVGLWIARYKVSSSLDELFAQVQAHEKAQVSLLNKLQARLDSWEIETARSAKECAR